MKKQALAFLAGVGATSLVWLCSQVPFTWTSHPSHIQTDGRPASWYTDGDKRPAPFNWPPIDAVTEVTASLRTSHFDKNKNLHIRLDASSSSAERDIRQAIMRVLYESSPIYNPQEKILGEIMGMIWVFAGDRRVDVSYYHPHFLAISDGNSYRVLLVDARELEVLIERASRLRPSASPQATAGASASKSRSAP